MRIGIYAFNSNGTKTNHYNKTTPFSNMLSFITESTFWCRINKFFFPEQIYHLLHKNKRKIFIN